MFIVANVVAFFVNAGKGFKIGVDNFKCYVDVLTDNREAYLATDGKCKGSNLLENCKTCKYLTKNKEDRNGEIERDC